MWKFLGHFWSVRTSLGTDLGICIIIYIINYDFLNYMEYNFVCIGH